jgi:hypothetical protein
MPLNISDFLGWPPTRIAPAFVLLSLKEPHNKSPSQRGWLAVE